MIKELISIICPVYNAEEFINETINSILNQSYGLFELILLNDGSTDSTVDIISNFSDTRIILLNRKHEGYIAQLNYGIKIATGKYIARMDSDDIMETNRLKNQMQFLIGNKQIDLVGSNAIYIDEKGHFLYERKFPEFHENIEFMMPVLTAICHPTIMTYKTVLEQIGGYNQTVAPGDDLDLFLRLLKNGYKLHNLQEPLLKYRIRKNSEGRKNVQRAHFIGYSLGRKYLESIYTTDISRQDFDYLYRMGILEYYKGSLKIARMYLLKAYSKRKLFKIFRYIIPTLLGEKFWEYLHKIGLRSFLSIKWKNITGSHLYSIKKN